MLLQPMLCILPVQDCLIDTATLAPFRWSHVPEHGASGHGLDWVWPFSLAYPQEEIAIINDVCVIHPKRELQPGSKLTIYQEHNPHAELVAVLAKFGYEAEVCMGCCDSVAVC